MSEKSIKEQLEELEAQRLIRDHIASTTRARSIAVGTAFGGTTEVNMRCDDGRSVWCLMQPVEVVELINQLAANVGCHIALKPRKDFATWRDWRVTEEEKLHYNGWAPFVNDMAPFVQIGKEYVDQEMLKQMEIKKPVEVGGGRGGTPNGMEPPHIKATIDEPVTNPSSRRNKNAMATEKLDDRRSFKRAAKTS